MSPFPEKKLTVGGDNPFKPSLLAAINHASEISITTAFIRQTGLNLICEALNDAILRNAKIRILTGDYLGITDPKALKNLLLMQEKGAEVKLFHSSKNQSFHMKAYIFLKGDTENQEEGCAFVGSSNISRMALEEGFEWNLKIDTQKDPNGFANILGEFEKIYNNPNSKILTHQIIDEYIARIEKQPKTINIIPGDDEQEPSAVPNSVQKEALVALNQTRENSYRRGLVVLATGMGKTWLAAFDTEQVEAARVLFVAHREEILKQAEETFIRIRPGAKIGLYNGVSHEMGAEMLFASVQTLGKSQHYKKFSEDHFDYIIVDEFHHAAARTYQQLLGYFTPKFLLGLTATPDRTDQSNILTLCDNNLVYRKDLVDGINSELLCPFQYYGIKDVVDYTEIRWRNGKFDPEELINQLATQARAKHNLETWKKHGQSKTLSFCISQRHADFMADFFNKNGVRAVSVHSHSEVKRNEALSQLKLSEIKVIFSVDLFNEGVDLPEIDTILMLRPTESKIIFLQQLGRGLRTSDNKSKLVILDFIGNHISFFRKPEALFALDVSNKARREFIKRLKENNLELPKGCFVNFDLKSIDILEQLTKTRADRQLEIYRNLRESYSRRPTLNEFYMAGGAVETVRNEYGQWFDLVSNEDDLNIFEKSCFEQIGGFFLELEKTQLTKSFKLVLLEALVELDGFQSPPLTILLATKSFEIFQRRRNLVIDLPEEYQSTKSLPDKKINKWHSYWKGNPINAWIGGNINSDKAFFEIKKERFCFKDQVDDVNLDAFTVLVQEIINYRFMQYEGRLANAVTESPLKVLYFESEDKQEIQYFTDLKFACGHFKSSGHDSENIEFQKLPLSFGKLNPAKHFIAKATGNSMNGGKNPIKDGDYLLLELITPENAGSISGLTIAAEQQDVAGDDQYLLRTVKKIGNNRYELVANNPDYSPMEATESMRTFARLKNVLSPSDLFLHQSFYREDIPGLFNLEFNTGLWQSGHICPKDHLSQYLLVTLNKQGKERNHQYHDYFKDKDTFYWQSQNSAHPDSSKGKAIINHVAINSQVHLFVRKNKLEQKKGAPFFYCGTVKYLDHTSEKPMNVEWKLNDSLLEDLFEYFKL